MNRRHNRRNSKADFLEQIRGAKPVDLGAAQLIKAPVDDDQVKHYVFEKRMQIAASIYGSAMGLIMTSKEWPAASPEQKDGTSETFASLAWDRATYLLQEAGLADIVNSEPPPQGATGGPSDETQEEDAAQPLPSDEPEH